MPGMIAQLGSETLHLGIKRMAGLDEWKELYCVFRPFERFRFESLIRSLKIRWIHSGLFHERVMLQLIRYFFHRIDGPLVRVAIFGDAAADLQEPPVLKEPVQ